MVVAVSGNCAVNGAVTVQARPDRRVQTKLLVPRLRAGGVVRPRLDLLLARGAETRLTLVSAPAGFGKTTLLSTWLATHDGRPTAWVSLDERDLDASTFWTYVLLAVDRAAPGTASGWTIWPTRSSTASPITCGASYWIRQFSNG
jgi:LuxR family maltose regulon positive regulatory protein